jgi:ribonuclease G
MSDLGLVEMTRKRVKKSLGRSLTMACPYCEGRGRVKSTQTIAFEVERELLSAMRDYYGRKIKVYVHPAVAEKLNVDEKDIIEKLEAMFGKKIDIIPVKDYHIEEFTLAKSD